MATVGAHHFLPFPSCRDGRRGSMFGLGQAAAGIYPYAAAADAGLRKVRVPERQHVRGRVGERHEGGVSRMLEERLMTVVPTTEDQILRYS